MDPMFEEAPEWVVVKPIERAEFVIRSAQIYELNGPAQDGRPAVVGIIHAYGKKEEVLIPIFLRNYYELRERLTGQTTSETEIALVNALASAQPPKAPALKFEPNVVPGENT